ncbi:dTDP-4-dehydrorhamnose reductase family protein [Leptospira idonii]|uniref:dTDP-4-dehydrorhamnose reductase n=1 Tax=Leptospira idonii TaxID=1193500 RepID=A0A4R9LY68_9LEPT|nr:SDR family oxidoreductase [Leptospira idonii]TGN18287.1 SDR family oxidoreductase [Leptospira idonii]
MNNIKSAKDTKKILILGVTGMLGNAIFRVLSENFDYHVLGTARNSSNLRYFSEQEGRRIITNIDVLNVDELVSVFNHVRPDIVINCIGLIKQHKDTVNDPLVVLPINSIFPHRLSKLCKLVNARLILFSTDCVFDGKKGNYSETDFSNAEDLYGKSKEIGEISSENHVFTIRTSIIGHELSSSYSLVNWFLSQSGSVQGYKKAIFSGFPTYEIGRIIDTWIIPNPGLSGLYHVSADPISKYDLLALLAKEYNKKNEIIASEHVVIDRSLNCDKFKNATGFRPKDWKTLVKELKSSGEKYIGNVYVR